ncbi:MAG TPA: RNA polymerase sigma factor, partial [Candidatus Limnocylindria bacterium]|nr:RNA polymerase sigma factor [Candidatus Limnocylindria bacterium]
NSVFSISSSSIGQDRDALAGLLAQAKLGEQAALGEIYDLYFKKIYRFIFYRVSHKEIAEDLAEEVFLKAFAKISTVNENQAFEGWLYQIARNLIIDYYRQKKTTVALEDVENTLEYETNVIDIFSLQEKQKVLLKILKELGAEQQVVIKLKFLEGLENAEIAEMLHKNEGAIRVIQHRAIAKLQEIIKRIQGENNE